MIGELPSKLIRGLVGITIKGLDGKKTWSTFLPSCLTLALYSQYKKHFNTLKDPSVEIFCTFYKAKQLC